jgi:type II secretory pathway pseudopilin PulG
MKPRYFGASAQRKNAFTLVELAVLAATVAVLGAVLLPAFASSGRWSETSRCLNNHKQLGQAWLLYCADNGDRMMGNLDGGNIQNPSNTNMTWCVGWLDYSGGVPLGADTNTLYLRNSQLGKYAASVSIYKCPSDRSLSRGKSGDQRVRSISMNGNVGSRSASYTGGYTQFTKLGDLSFHGPSQTFVFVDEREDSINDGWFPIDMTGYDPVVPASYLLVDLPGAYHSRSGTFSFADGRAELHRWTDSRTVPPLRVGSFVGRGPMPGNQDVDWLQNHATFRQVNPTR